MLNRYKNHIKLAFIILLNIIFDRFQQGLYGSFVGSLMYVFLGTCKEVPMGPTAIVSLMTYNTLQKLGPVYGTLLCFLTGVIQLVIGIVGLGKNTDTTETCYN